MKTIHCAIGSTLSFPGDIAANLDQIARFGEQAARDGVDLLLTPELSACGYGSYPEVLATAEIAGEGPIYRRLAEIAKTSAAVVCAGFVESRNGRKHISHYVVYPDGGFLVQRKHRVTPGEHPLDPVSSLHPDPDKPDEFQPDELHLEAFTVSGIKCTIAICADIGIKDLSSTLAQRGAELLLCPSGAGGKEGDRMRISELQSPGGRARYTDELEKLFFPGNRHLVGDCIEFRRGLLEVNINGFDGRDYYHCGHGMVINPMGEVLGFLPGFPVIERQRPAYAHAVMDLDEFIAQD